jgi:hypothetical protein
MMCAAGCTVGGVLLFAVAIDNLRSVPAGGAVIAQEAPDPAPMGEIPAGVARVPLLLLANSRAVHLGDRLGDVIDRWDRRSNSSRSHARRLLEVAADALL